MAFFKRKRKATIDANVNVADVYVVTARIVSSYNNGHGCSPMCVTMYFLAKCEKGEYYELFSGTKLEREKQPEGGCLFRSFDTPYVKKVEPLTEFLVNPKKKTISIQSLFSFITNTNVMGRLGAFSKD